MSPPRILVVDDNRDAGEIIGCFLELRGFQVEYAFGGLTGLTLAKATMPDLVILNLTMPGMNGLTVLHELRDDSETKGMKVIMTSGDWRIAEEAPRAGAQDFVVYPVKFTEFGPMVDRVLRS